MEDEIELILMEEEKEMNLLTEKISLSNNLQNELIDIKETNQDLKISLKNL